MLEKSAVPCARWQTEVHHVGDPCCNCSYGTVDQSPMRLQAGFVHHTTMMHIMPDIAAIRVVVVTLIIKSLVGLAGFVPVFKAARRVVP
jgi:hypothetical protein